jgi:hypothetical protein
MKKYFLLCLLLSLFHVCEAKLKVLHLGFHHGIEAIFKNVANELDLDITSWLISELPDFFFDPLIEKCSSPTLYNIGHDRAERIWQKHHQFFNSFDVIVTSDTAVLARIFLQNHYDKHLVIWICNRFDFRAKDFLDCPFPDPEFYALFREAKHNKKITFVNFSPIEAVHARFNHVDTGDLVIKPYGASLEVRPGPSLIPSNIDKSATFFIPHYYNNIKAPHKTVNFSFGFNLPAICNKLGIPYYCGRYNGPRDIEAFKAIIHIPYAFSTTSQFENLELGMIHFIPSKELLQLLRKNQLFFFASDYLLNDHLDLVEFYCEEVKPHIVYFDSWKDLSIKIHSLDYEKKREEIKAFAKDQREKALQAWRHLFLKIQQEIYP